MNVLRALKTNNITNPLYMAANGLEALVMLRGNGKPPVIPLERRSVLLDINMPKMNGLDFLRKLRADPQLKLIPVIILTTSSQLPRSD